MDRISTAAVITLPAFGGSSAYARKPIAHPAKGQSSQRWQKDDRECLAWAKSETGIDPAVASARPPQQTGPATGGGERARGAARGAVGGVAVGAIVGDAGAGAGVGAVAGTMAGGRFEGAQEPGRAERAGDATATADPQHLLPRIRCLPGGSRIHDQVTHR